MEAVLISQLNKFFPEINNFRAPIPLFPELPRGVKVAEEAALRKDGTLSAQRIVMLGQLKDLFPRLRYVGLFAA